MSTNFKKAYDAKRIHWFIAVGEGLDTINQGGSVSFRQYTDHANAHGIGPGSLVQYVTSKDGQGKAIGKWFTLDESRRRFQVRDGEQDINQITQFDFLKFAPDCEGSPNGTYDTIGESRVQRGVRFRELDTDKDATVALDAETRRTQAQSSVLQLDPTTLQEVASSIAVFGEPDSLMKLKVFEWAGKRPSEYFKALESGDRSLRAVVRKAIADGTFTQKGSLIYWESTLVGADEDSAISTLAKDEQMLDALQKKVDLKVEVAATVPKKQGRGRPAGSKNVPKDAETVKT